MSCVQDLLSQSCGDWSIGIGIAKEEFLCRLLRWQIGGRWLGSWLLWGEVIGSGLMLQMRWPIVAQGLGYVYVFVFCWYKLTNKLFIYCLLQSDFF